VKKLNRSKKGLSFTSRSDCVIAFLICKNISYICTVIEVRGGKSPLFSITGELVMQIEKRVTELVEEKISDRPELFLVEVKMLPNNKLIIHVDGDEGITIQDCAAISRHVGFHLEEENTIDKAYNLEVSSPGVGEPLKLKRQYDKNIGRDLSVKLAGGEIKEGKLLFVDDKGITIEAKVKEKGKKAVLVETGIDFNSITETKVLISFK
jgi:ribosome maturation factor RimP